VYAREVPVRRPIAARVALGQPEFLRVGRHRLGIVGVELQEGALLGAVNLAHAEPHEVGDGRQVEPQPLYRVDPFRP
jgi:hypothetical protein